MGLDPREGSTEILKAVEPIGPNDKGVRERGKSKMTPEPSDSVN